MPQSKICFTYGSDHLNEIEDPDALKYVLYIKKKYDQKISYVKIYPDITYVKDEENPHKTIKIDKSKVEIFFAKPPIIYNEYYIDMPEGVDDLKNLISDNYKNSNHTQPVFNPEYGNEEEDNEEDKVDEYSIEIIDEDKKDESEDKSKSTIGDNLSFVSLIESDVTFSEPSMYSSLMDLNYSEL